MSRVPQSLRSLVRRPAVVIGGAVILGLAIGMSAALYGLVRAVALAPLRSIDSSNVHAIHFNLKAPYGLFAAKARPTTWLGLAGVRELIRHPPPRVTAVVGIQSTTVVARSGNHAERVMAEMATGDYERVFRLTPSAGRLLGPGDDDGFPTVAVVSDRLWREWYAPARAQPGAATLLINGKSLTVVGAAARGFRGTQFGRGAEVWLPANAHLLVPELQGDGWGFGGQLHMRTEEHVDSRSLAAMVSASLANGPNALSPREWAISANSASTFLGADQFKPFIWLMLTFGALVLVAGAVNVANLLHVHFSARDREFATRRAIGASPRSLVGLCVIDVGALGALGLAVGLAVAWMVLSAVGTVAPAALSAGRYRRAVTTYAVFADQHVVLYAISAALITVTFLAITCARRMLRVSLDTRSVAAGGSGTSSATAPARARRVVVALQVAIATITLLGTTSFVRRAMPAQPLRPTIDTAGVQSARFDLSLHGYSPVAGREFYRRLVDAVSALPDVASAAITDGVPGHAYVSSPTFQIVAEPAPGAASNTPRRFINGSYAGVSAGFFDVFRVRIIRGRAVAPSDGYDAPRVAVISESIATRLWPETDPLGKRLMFGNEGQWLTIVGVSADPIEVAADQRYVCAACVVFVPFEQRYEPQMVLAVRPVSAGGIAAQMTSAIAAQDRDVIPFELGSLDSTLLATLWRARAFGLLISSVGLVAMLIAAFGIYATTSYFVALRHFEIGVRVALGATPRHVISLVLRDARLVALSGILGGVFIVAVGERTLLNLTRSFMPNDVPTWTIVLLSVLVVAAIAAYLPARRAARAIPADILRGPR
jgi:putative ABC transport system permease protein